jgi:hypothetical protein
MYNMKTVLGHFREKVWSREIWSIWNKIISMTKMKKKDIIDSIETWRNLRMAINL